MQWNPSITDTFGEQSFGRYTEVAFVEGLFCVHTLHLGPVYLAVISQLAFLQGWPLRGVPLYKVSCQQYMQRHEYGLIINASCITVSVLIISACNMSHKPSKSDVNPCMSTTRELSSV